MDLLAIAVCLILLTVANGSPVLAADVFKSRWARPVDGGRMLADGRPWFGASKTWRGIVTAVLATAAAGELLQVGWQAGAAVGALAMLGDLLSSFIKRRLGITTSGRAWLLDQVPESALPALILKEPLGLSSYLDVLWVAVIFFVLEVGLSPLLYKLHIRKRPY
jgi:CDP-2,3-bis-(O-geranylgeranyl)-sn-glycerol synthase